jgi:tRNA G18 (ribose-2'-O)-methylase SpoU
LVQRCCGDSSFEDDINGAVASPPPVQVHSILCKRNTFFEAPVRLIDDVEKRISNKHCPFKVIIGSEDAISEIIGFNIARGALACGVVPTYFHTNGCKWLTQTIQQKTHVRLLALDAISDTANLGSIIRTAAALSIDAIVLSDDSCDAFYRQAVRVSMGHVINVPTLRVSDWKKGIDSDDVSQSESGGLVEFISWLRVQMKVQCLAAVVDDENDSDTEKDDTQPPLITLESLSQRRNNDPNLGSWCCVLGNEGNGIRTEVIAKCDKRIKIGMASGVDSMSLPVAAAIMMHGLSL